VPACRFGRLAGRTGKAMPIENINTAFQTQAMQSQPAAPTAAERGVFMGHAVQVSESPESLLADAAEELGFSVDNTKDYDVNERKERGKAALSQLERVRMYEELMHKVGKGQQLDRLVDSIRKNPKDFQQIERQAREAFPDPSDAWAALKIAAERLKEAGESPDTIAAIERAAAEMEKTDGVAIRTGIQGALSSAGYESIGEPDSLKDLYRTTVGEFSSVNEVFTSIQKTYGNNFEKAMDFLFSAISSDINSDEPSMDKQHLESVHTKLGLVRLTQSGYRLCCDQMNRWADVHGVTNSSIDAMGLLGEIIALRGQPFLSANSIKMIVDKVNPPDIEKEVLFTQDLLKTTRSFPSALFDDDAGRMKVLTAVQEAVDEAVQREDDWLASMEG